VTTLLNKQSLLKRADEQILSNQFFSVDLQFGSASLSALAMITCASHDCSWTRDRYFTS